MSRLGAAWRTTVRASRWAVGTDASDGWTDVWSRVGHKYRHRAAILLVLDLLLFMGLCIFMYWLRTGEYVPFRGPSYFSLLLNSFRPSGPDQVNLASMLIAPINVERTPMQMVILALVMAALVSVPILVSILYRFPFAVPFALMISLVAVLPWLGITALLACAVASLRPLRMHFRFASALLGMVPFGIYLWLSLRSGDQMPAVSSPIDQFKMYSPWMLSMMAACFNLAVVLSLASLVGYRPGAIAPVLAILFAVPVVLFETQIGQDELYYSKLEADYGPNAPNCFRSGSVTEFLMQDSASEALDIYSKTYGAMGEPLENLRNVWRANLPTVQPLKQKVEQSATLDMERDRDQVIEQAERFVADFPNSPRVPAALYLQGRALDTHLDMVRLHRDGVLVYYDEFPSSLSRGVWQSLVGSYEDYPLANVARLKLAIAAMRRNDLSGALSLLEQIQIQAQEQDQARRHQARPGGTTPDGWFVSLMPPAPAEETLGVDTEEVALQARQMRELLQANGDDPRYGAEPLQLLYRMDPHHERYRDNLLWLDETFPGALLHDNIQLLLALANRSVSVRISYLERHLVVYAGQDSTAQATYELGRLLEEDARYSEAIERYGRLAAGYPNSVWSLLGSQRAAALKLSMGK